MSARRRNPRRPRSRDRDGLIRRPAVWLATLSTVVGIATGMFTLRDQVFPRASGTAVAASEDAYQGNRRRDLRRGQPCGSQARPGASEGEAAPVGGADGHAAA